MPGAPRFGGFISIHALLAESDSHHTRTNHSDTNFYPRSPCGERLNHSVALIPHQQISIHALLAESDNGIQSGAQQATAISIHALLAESDPQTWQVSGSRRDFYPRSPCGERPAPAERTLIHGGFLSTLSLRRATPEIGFVSFGQTISIHALLAESDPDYAHTCRDTRFLSTLSLRRATHGTNSGTNSSLFLSTLSLRRATF